MTSSNLGFKSEEFVRFRFGFDANTFDMQPYT